MISLLATIYLSVGIYAAQYNIDPRLVMAVIEVESNFNHKAVGPQGEIGLMQLHPRYFPTAQFNISHNVRVGVKHLAFMRKNCPHKKHKTWLICYNRGFKKTKNPYNNSYYKKVMKAYRRRL
jgi:soluble lytic murein transglycosylase-like protein